MQLIKEMTFFHHRDLRRQKPHGVSTMVEGIKYLQVVATALHRNCKPTARAVLPLLARANNASHESFVSMKFAGKGDTSSRMQSRADSQY